MENVNFQDYLSKYTDLQKMGDTSDYGLRQHYNKYGRGEGRTFKGQEEYERSQERQFDDRFFNLEKDEENKKITAEKATELRNALLKDKYTPSADLSQFEGLLGKLEASKMKQAGSAALDTRRNTYAQGLAQMMSNF